MIIERINSKDKFGRDILFISTECIEDFDLNKLPALSKYFTLFIANNIELDEDKYFEKAKELIKSGLAYMCAWGKGCSMLDDIFDDASVRMEIEGEKETDDDENVIMTTWHEDETLKNALEFFLMNTSPTAKYFDECKTAIVLKIGDSSETKHLRDLLENQNWSDY